ncbi:DUF4231 domain-containing protein [bacterium]|nr:DUF4231 domain-containing protein [bacterium]
MDEATYIKSRVDDQIDWYNRKSTQFKRLFIWFQVIVIVSSSSIPVINIYGEHPEAVLIVSILGALIAILSSMISLLSFREHWVEYRTVCETLKHEKLLYQTRTDPYDNGEARFNLFVQNVETLISQEHTKWRQLFSNGKKRDDKQA